MLRIQFQLHISFVYNDNSIQIKCRMAAILTFKMAAKMAENYFQVQWNFFTCWYEGVITNVNVKSDLSNDRYFTFRPIPVTECGVKQSKSRCPRHQAPLSCTTLCSFSQSTGLYSFPESSKNKNKHLLPSPSQ